ncbi:hypothetical protein [Mycobacterium sp. IS-1590]|uniref:hypothetical protein n=1 Tax=Mycobacterium sp. IS-1590 TaxID=1772286 RepID=UPI000AC90F79|nr:hypothetical protein [Mycobacterium sp. IS-1590]
MAIISEPARSHPNRVQHLPSGDRLARFSEGRNRSVSSFDRRERTAIVQLAALRSVTDEHVRKFAARPNDLNIAHD